MHILKGLFITLLMLVFASGCAVHELNRHQVGDKLAAGHGLLALSAASPNHNLAFEITPVGIPDESYKSPPFASGHDVAILQLPYGSYHISAVYERALIWQFVQPEAKDAFVFDIVPDTVTLVGDISLNGDAVALELLNVEHYQRVMQQLEPLANADIQMVTGSIDRPTRYWAIGWRHCNGRIIDASGLCNNSGLATFAHSPVR